MRTNRTQGVVVALFAVGLLTMLWQSACFARIEKKASYSVMQTPFATFDVQRTDVAASKDEFMSNEAHYAFKIRTNQFGAKSYQICVDYNRSKFDQAQVSMGKCVIVKSSDYSAKTIVRQIRKYNVESAWSHELAFRVSPLPHQESKDRLRLPEGNVDIKETAGLLSEADGQFQFTDFVFSGTPALPEGHELRMCIDRTKLDCPDCILPTWRVPRLPFGATLDLPNHCTIVSPKTEQSIPLRILQKIDDLSKRPPKPKVFFTHEVNSTAKIGSDGKRN